MYKIETKDTTMFIDCDRPLPVDFNPAYRFDSDSSIDSY